MSSELKVDTISEKTTASGVTIDGLLIKDGAIPSIPGGKLLQVVTNTDTGTTSSTTGSSSYVTTTTLDTITPVAAGSKFLVTATGTANNGGDSKGSSYTIMAKVNAGSYAQFGTLNPANSAGYAQLYTNGATDAWIPTSIQVFDTVTYSLTDTITFAVHLIGKGPGTDGTTSAKWGHYAVGDAATNTITIMEVAG
jgi:hypothetical protein